MKTLTILIIASFIFGCSAKPLIYPDHWWAPLGDADRASWEIAPQSADRSKNEVILSKRNELGLLSNFAATPFVFRGKKYASLEGFWQSLKYPESVDDLRNTTAVSWVMSREQVRGLTAFEAKKAGSVAEENMKKLGIDWITFENEKIYYKTTGQQKHYQLIERATRAKIDQNPEIRRVLLATGNLVLKPDHSQKPTDPPAWRYYEIYMKLREELSANPNKKLTEIGD